MEVPPIALGLLVLSFWGGGAALWRDLSHAAGDCTTIPADVGAVRGTLIHTVGSAGFVTMDWRSQVRSSYRGGAITMDETGQRSA